MMDQEKSKRAMHADALCHLGGQAKGIARQRKKV
jgi:hypothetical protein